MDVGKGHMYNLPYYQLSYHRARQQLHYSVYRHRHFQKGNMTAFQRLFQNSSVFLIPSAIDIRRRSRFAVVY
jgi:hypothetical protein